ncbi:MAG: class I SAM-dependent methyltransferase, partial [Bacteroidota bacterium]
MATNKSLAHEAMNTKGKPLQKMFERVPDRYDFLNRLLTFRLDEMWRKKAVKEIVAEHPREVMDVGTGTGDLAGRVARRLSDTRVIGYDFS